MTRYRLDSQFNCSYLESRSSGKTPQEISILAGNYLPLISVSCDIISGDVVSGDVISGDEPPYDPPQMINRWCIYTTNTEILNNKIKRNIKYNWTHIYVFSGRRNQYTSNNAVFIPTVTIPHWRFMIFNIDMICPIIQHQRY